MTFDTGRNNVTTKNGYVYHLYNILNICNAIACNFLRKGHYELIYLMA